MGIDGHKESERTTRQQFWLEHIEACQERGVSLKAYAAEHGLSVSAMYAARSEMKRRSGDGSPGTRPVDNRFVSVRVTPASALRIHLPNGIVVEVPDAVEPGRLDAVLSSVSARS